MTWITENFENDPDVNNWDHRQFNFENAIQFASKGMVGGISGVLISVVELAGIAASAQSVVRKGGKVKEWMREKNLSLFTYNIAK